MAKMASRVREVGDKMSKAKFCKYCHRELAVFPEGCCLDCLPKEMEKESILMFWVGLLFVATVIGLIFVSVR